MTEARRQTFLRWLKFNLVGLIGFAVQLSVLALLVSGLGLHYMPATVLAVESAILHNFLWHERYTWRDRVGGQPGWLSRLARFHGANGLISLAGNAAIMALLVGEWGVPYLVANLVAVVVCSLLNFAAGDLLVFRARKAP
jgi:putative flippase GtrA